MSIAIVAARTAGCEEIGRSWSKFFIFTYDFNIWVPWIKFEHGWSDWCWFDVLNNFGWYLSLFNWWILFAVSLTLRCISSFKNCNSPPFVSYFLSWWFWAEDLVILRHLLIWFRFLNSFLLFSFWNSGFLGHRFCPCWCSSWCNFFLRFSRFSWFWSFSFFSCLSNSYNLC